jgi:hypothetical protein
LEFYGLGFGKNLSFIPDPEPGVKKAPDAGSATLATMFTIPVPVLVLALPWPVYFTLNWNTVHLTVFNIKEKDSVTVHI